MRLLHVLAFTAFVSSLARAEPRNAPASNANLAGAPGHPKEQVRYEYRYAVDDPSSGVVSQRWEHRLGEYVKGAYSFVEPDGSVRHVDYEVDGKRGFHAVIRTTPPANALLSSDQLSKSRQHHRQPPVNVLTNQPEAAASASVSAGVSPEQTLNPGTPLGGRGGRRLPLNFHSVRPDYYLAFAKGEPARYRESTPALELPLETPAEVEAAHAPPQPPPPPAPAREPAFGHASSHHHHPVDYATLRALLGGPPQAPQHTHVEQQQAGFQAVQAPQQVRHRYQQGLHETPQALQALRAFQRPQEAIAQPAVPRGRALYPPAVPRGATPGPAAAPLSYPTHTEVIFQPFPPITLAADLFAG